METERLPFYQFDKTEIMRFYKIRCSLMAKIGIQCNNLHGRLQSLLIFYMVMQW